MIEPGAAINLFRMGDRWQWLNCKKIIKRFYFNMEPRLKILFKNFLAAKRFLKSLKNYFNMEPRFYVYRRETQRKLHRPLSTRIGQVPATT